MSALRPTPLQNVRISRACNTCPRNIRSLVVRAGLFDNLFGGGGGKTSPQAAELVEELLDLSRKTNGGSKANAQTRERISELATELKGYRPRNATRSPQFTGTYDVTYCSNPRAPGGPVLRSPPGQLLAANQRLRQTLEAPNLFQNSIEFKTLGIFPGSATQDGTYKILSGTRYQVDLEPADLKLAGNKGIGQGGSTVSRVFDVLYLDEQARVVEYLPEDESDSQLFVFERVQEDMGYEEEAEPEAEDDEEDAVEKAPKKGLFAGFGAPFGRKPAAEEEEDEEASAPEPTPSRGPQRGTRRLTKAASAKTPPRELSPEEQKQEEIRQRLADLQAAYNKQLAASKETLNALKGLEKESRDAMQQAKPLQRGQQEADQAAAQAEEAAEEAIARQNELVEALSGARQRVKELQSR